MWTAIEKIGTFTGSLLRYGQEVGHKTIKKLAISTTGNYFVGGLFYFITVLWLCAVTLYIVIF